MKSIVLYFYSITKSGGAERRICQLAGELSNRNYKVYLCSLDKPESISYYSLERGVTWWKLGGKRHGLYGKLTRTIALYSKLRKNNVKVLIGFVMSADKTIYLAAKLAKVRLVVAERNSPIMYLIRLSKIQRQLVFTLMRFADKITVQTSAFILQYPQMLHERIVSISNPVECVKNSALPALSNQRGRFTIIAVSRLDNLQKRIDLLVKSFILIAEEFTDWDLKIIGDGQDKDILADLIAASNYSQRIELVGDVKDVSKYYKSANIFVIPSQWEGFPNALAEAMSFGLPAIGFFESSGVMELIDKGGWLVEKNGCVEDLAENLRVAMSNPNERKKRGELAKALMQPFTPEKHLSAWDGLIKSLL